MFRSNLVKKVLAILVVFAFLFSSLGTTAILALDDNQPVIKVKKNKVERDKKAIAQPKLKDKKSLAYKSEPDLAKGRKELLEKRGANIKVFEDNSGNRQALVFNQKIHYKDERGKYQDINNSIVTLNKALSRATGIIPQLGKYKYTNNANEFDTLFTGGGRPAAAFLYKGSYLEFSPRVETQVQPTLNADANFISCYHGGGRSRIPSPKQWVEGKYYP